MQKLNFVLCIDDDAKCRDFRNRFLIENEKLLPRSYSASENNEQLSFSVSTYTSNKLYLWNIKLKPFCLNYKLQFAFTNN